MNDFDYPENFVEETNFPVFSPADAAKIQSLFHAAIAPSVVQFWRDHSGRKFRKNGIIMFHDDADEVQGFVQHWFSGAEILERLTWLDEQIHDAPNDQTNGEQLIELRKNYLSLAQVHYFSRQILLCKLNDGNGQIFLLDEELGQYVFEPIAALEPIAASFQTFAQKHLIDFEAKKHLDNLFW